MTRPRRRAKRPADVDYDREADTPTEGSATGVERIDEDFYRNERPPHYGGDWDG
ncbi:hypothetical protein [Corynebacterium auris]|uniref:hypothetical protein n=1 Tax=Corynebacterium auris TaxID=44750 RepID=UPI0025B34B08|nr:hypothetical protein [Corynebacterium auris]WJY67625.1 hypothetical protein CAURIS_03530 [Corynebacterium auris]